MLSDRDRETEAFKRGQEEFTTFLGRSILAATECKHTKDRSGSITELSVRFCTTTPTEDSIHITERILVPVDPSIEQAIEIVTNLRETLLDVKACQNGNFDRLKQRAERLKLKNEDAHRRQEELMIGPSSGISDPIPRP